MNVCIVEFNVLLYVFTHNMKCMHSYRRDGAVVDRNNMGATRFPGVCVHAIWEPMGLGLKSQESRGFGTDHLQESRTLLVLDGRNADN